LKKIFLLLTILGVGVMLMTPTEARPHKPKKVITMNIADLLNKVSEAGVSLWDLQEFKLSVRDENNKPVNIADMKIDSDNKNIIIKMKK
jgi:ABC-type transporter MlaC component